MNYSIIIPHYNSSILLERLLKSIPTNDKFQIIVVDDNSKNEEYKAIELLQSNYCFELYRNEGKTAGGARNTGLKYAKGKWILFADADDYFEPNMESMISKYLESDYDIVFFNVISRYSDTGEKGFRDAHINNLIKKVSQGESENLLRCCYLVPWGKLFRRSLIERHEISFEEIIAGNDVMFSAKCGVGASKITYNTSYLYCVTVTGGSITNIYTKDRFESRLMSIIRLNSFLRKNNYSKYQSSVLYFLGESYKYGIKFSFHIWWICLKNKCNPFIGLHKVFKIQEIIKQEQIRSQLTKNKKNN